MHLPIAVAEIQLLEQEDKVGLILVVFEVACGLLVRLMSPSHKPNQTYYLAFLGKHSSPT